MNPNDPHIGPITDMHAETPDIPVDPHIGPPTVLRHYERAIDQPVVNPAYRPVLRPAQIRRAQRAGVTPPVLPTD